MIKLLLVLISITGSVFSQTLHFHDGRSLHEIGSISTFNLGQSPVGATISFNSNTPYRACAVEFKTLQEAISTFDFYLKNKVNIRMVVCRLKINSQINNQVLKTDDFYFHLRN